MIQLLNKIISTFFFLGYLPFSASLASIPAILIYLFFPNNFLLIGVLIAIGIFSTDAFSRNQRVTDPKYIIIDELIGQIIALYLIQPTNIHLILSFFFFRLFDITKPLFIAKSQKLPGGWGIVIDDILAGLLANIVVRAISFYL